MIPLVAWVISHVAVAGAPAVPSAAPTAAPEMCHSTAPSPFTRSEHGYVVPDLALTDQGGHPVSMRAIAASDQPVALNFIFATCTTICPVMTATFSQVREELGADAARVKFVSITIDPEHDTPAVLAAYAERFEAPADWAFLTGASADVEQVLRAFDAWSGSKLAHQPITLLHAPGRDGWIRLEGLGGGAALAAEVRPLLAAR
ncbi:MAG: SCO family protein [Myxococcota bacterium]